jgi:rubrerythrin
MDLAALFFLLAVVVLVGLYVARPFMVKSKRARVAVEDHEYSSLLAERDRLINALRELDFDQSLGKVPEAEYPLQRAELRSKAAEVLRAIDQREQTQSAQTAEDRLEAAIAARRADADAARPELSDDDLESMLASRRAGRTEKSGGFCPNCGKPVQRSDRFCPHCGKTVK